MLQKIIKPINKKVECPIEIRLYRIRSRSRDQDKNKSSVSVDLNDFSSDLVKQNRNSEYICSSSSKEINELQEYMYIIDQQKQSKIDKEKTAHFNHKIGQQIMNYRVLSLLSDGTFGRVLLVEDTDEIKYALKVVKAVESYSENAHLEAKTVSMLWKFKSKNIGQSRIVRLFDEFEYEGHYCLLFERLGQSLYDILREGGFRGIKVRDLKSYIKQTLQGLAYLHEIGITHTDLKPENLMVQVDGSLKIIDFGGATWDRESRLHRINTRQYRAPEVILGCGQWGHPSDIWCLGCISIELYSGNLFFRQDDCYQHLWMIEKQCGQIPKWMVEMSCFNYGCWSGSEQNSFIQLQDIIDEKDGSLFKLIDSMLQIDPTQRITAIQALNHPFLKEI